MKKFTCCYLKEHGAEDSKAPNAKIEANSAEKAAHIYAEQYPSDYPKIEVSSAWEGPQLVDNPVRRDLERQRRAKEAIQELQRLESFQMLHSSVESADGNLAGLSYIELSALVENLRDFPVMRDKISAEDRVVREELYKAAFFDRNLQAALQTEQAALQVGLLRDLKSAFTGLQSGKSGSGAGKSNLARNVGMLGGIAALQKLNQIEENTADVSEGFGFD
jgi:hypothetical protein